MDVGNALSANGISGNQTLALANLSNNFDTFLTLLTKQLQNQDPLEPLDTNEFTAQLVQFTGVEQAIQTNQLLAQLVLAQQDNQLLGASAMIGKTIEASGGTAELVDGQASFLYGLPEDAERVTITITDASGAAVYTSEGQHAAGSYQFVWDGRGNDGTSQPDGTYTITVSAVDADGEVITVETGAVGKVTGVGIENGRLVAKLGDVAIPFASITAVREATS